MSMNSNSQIDFKLSKINYLFWIGLPILVSFLPIVEALGVQGISYISPSALELLGTALIASIILGGIGGYIDSRLTGHLRIFFRIICIVALILIFVELSGIINWINAKFGHHYLSGGSKQIMAMVAVGAIVIAGLSLLARGAALVISFVFLSIMLGATVVKHSIRWSTDVQVANSSSQPAIIHLLLDEMSGVAGLPINIPGGLQLKQQMEEIFAKHNFTLYPKAFSRHFMTAMSVPNLLNYDYEDATYGLFSKYQSKADFKINAKNRHFEVMRERGYSLSVFQTVFYDFCKSVKVERCLTFPSYSPWSKFHWSQNTELLRQSTAQVLHSANRTSILTRAYFQAFSGMTAAQLDMLRNPLRFDLHGLGNWMNALTESIRTNPRGVAHFAHVLAPHGPYILEKDCSVRGPWGQLPQFMREDRGLSLEAFVVERKVQYERYFKQSSCLMTLLDGLLERLTLTPELKDATILIFGDHGSRLSAGRFVESLSPEDHLDNYSTLYAIRHGNKPAAVNMRSTSVHRLFAEHFSPDVAQQADSQTIVIERKSPERVELVPMPWAN
jgi:hypothetical protein